MENWSLSLITYLPKIWVLPNLQKITGQISFLALVTNKTPLRPQKALRQSPWRPLPHRIWSFLKFIYLDDRYSIFFWNVHTCLPNYMSHIPQDPRHCHTTYLPWVLLTSLTSTLRVQVLWDVILCHGVSASPTFWTYDVPSEHQERLIQWQSVTFQKNMRSSRPQPKHQILHAGC